MAIRKIADLINPPKPSAGEDVARSTPTGLIEGVSGLLGTVGDIQDAARSGVDAVAKFAGKHGFGNGSAPAPTILGAGDYLSALTTAAAKKMGVDPRLARLATAIMVPATINHAPTTREVLGAVTKDRPLYQPQTRAGKYARTLAQFAPAAAAPGTAAQRLANVVAPALASEAAGQATEGTKLEPYARVAGAVAGGGLANLATRPGPRTRILAEAARGASDEQVAQARRLMEEAQAQGVRLTLSEAVQQVTNGATGMGRMQRVLEGTRAGNERIAPVMAERPGQVRQAIADFADTLAPPTDQPSMLGGAAQRGAEGALNDTRRFINFGAQQHYDELVNQHLSPDEYAGLTADPSYREALQALRGHPELGAQVANLPDENLAVVNEVIKRLNTTAEQARPGPMNPMGDNGLAALRDTAAGNAAEIASNASEDFRAARAGVAAGRQAYLEPLQRGPLGQIAATDNVRAQTGALFPNQPLEGSADETARAIEMLGTQDPNVAPALVRQHLVNTANEATQDLQSGANQWGGAKWAATQTGNPEQARTLEAGVQAVGGDLGRMNSLVEALRATGRRQPPGSLTAYNARDLEELGKSGALGEVMRTGLNAPGVFRRLGQGFQDWQTERNAGRLAEAILAEPAQAEAILLHARQVVPPGEGLATIERLAVQAQLARANSEHPALGGP